MPDSMMNTRKASTSFSRGEVSTLYDFQSDCTAGLSDETDAFAELAADAGVEDVFGAAMVVVERV